MNRYLLKLFAIQEGEQRKALYMFLYIFLLIAALLIVKPVRNGLFLSQVGISRLPYAFILVAVFAATVTQVYVRWIHRLRLDRLILGFLVISIIGFFLFWMLFKTGQSTPWLVFGFYVWVALFGVISTSHFWLLSGYVFHAREARRLFGFIGAGAISGGIFGGYLTRLLAPLIGTAHMILISAGFLAICILIAVHIWNHDARDNYSEKLARARKTGRDESIQNILNVLKQSRHLAYMAGIIGIGVVAANLVDYQFSAIASQKIQNEDQLTAFFGFWLSNLSIASLAIQLFLTARIFKAFGVITSLFFLPMGILAGAVCILFFPVLWAAILIKVTDGGFKQSINRSGLELLALPIPSHIKTQSKTFIDVFVDSMATGLGGLLLILVTRSLGFSTPYVSLLMAGCIGLWIYFIFRVKPEYVNAFRTALKKRSIDLDTQTVNLDDVSLLESLIGILEGRNERQILYVLRLIENVKNDKFVPYLKKLLHHASDEIRFQVLHIIHRFEGIDFAEDVKSLIHDDSRDVRVAAMRYLFKKSEDGTETLSQMFQHPEIRIRSSALLCAALENREDSQFSKRMDIKQLFDRFVENDYRAETGDDEMKLVRMDLADTIGIADEPLLYPFLEHLLRDSSLDVVERSILNAGATQDPMFIPLLIQHLSTARVRRMARESLAGYGNRAVESLEMSLENPQENDRIRRGIARVLAMIGTQEAVNILFRHLEQDDIRLRVVIIQSLNRMRTQFPLLKFDRKRVEKHIMQEIGLYMRSLSVLLTLKTLDPVQNLRQGEPDDTTRESRSRNLLFAAMEERLLNSVEIVFYLLGLIHAPRDMANAYQAVIGPSPSMRSQALELLDNTLESTIRRELLWILEFSHQREGINLPQGLETDKPQSENEALRILLEKDDYWIKSCSLLVIAENGRFDPVWMIENLTRHPDAMVRETAEYAMNRLHAESNHEDL